MDAEGGESDCGGGGVVWSENRVSDERERERGNEVELGLLILLKGIIVISCIQWGWRWLPLANPQFRHCAH